MNSPSPRLALVFAREESQWISCQSITKNLFLAYQEAFAGAAIGCFHYSEKQKGLEIYEVARTLKEFRPDKIIFIDHKPHPKDFLDYLDEFYEDGELPQFYFHLFGDFSLYTYDWMDVGRRFLKFKDKVLFLCASERQQEFVSQFFQDPSQVVYCPFPLDGKKFFFHQELRDQWREKLGLRPEELAILYTGRLSLQKNITTLIEEVYHFWKNRPLPSRLFLVGNFDNLGDPFFGIHFHHGHYFQVCSRLMEKIPSPFKEQIHFLGHLEPKELNGCLNAADIYTSLSLHNDEDFGMAPLEALFTGLPSVLSDWGGYSSFRLEGTHCRMVSTAFQQKGVKMNWEEFHGHLESLRSPEFRRQFPDRTASSLSYRKVFSIEAIGQRLRNIHRHPLTDFAGFNRTMEVFRAVMNRPERFDGGPVAGSFFQEVYRPYTTPQDSSARCGKDHSSAGSDGPLRIF